MTPATLHEFGVPVLHRNAHPAEVGGLALRKLASKGAPFKIEQRLKTLELAPKTKGNIRNVMAVIFNCAMRWGLLDLGVNPVALVRVKALAEGRQSRAS